MDKNIYTSLPEMEIIAHKNCQYLFQALLVDVYPILNILALAAAEGPRAESDSKNQENTVGLEMCLHQDLQITADWLKCNSYLRFAFSHFATGDRFKNRKLNQWFSPVGTVGNGVWKSGLSHLPNGYTVRHKRVLFFACVFCPVARKSQSTEKKVVDSRCRERREVEP